MSQHSSPRITVTHGAYTVVAHESHSTAFSAVAVYVSSAPVSDQEWSEFVGTVDWAGRPAPDDDPQYNFWEATRGRGQLEFDIAATSLR